MDIPNPFDKKLEIWGNRVPAEIRDAAVKVNDTLDLSWASAQSVFGAAATPEHALAILGHILAERRPLHGATD